MPSKRVNAIVINFILLSLLLLPLIICICYEWHSAILRKRFSMAFNINIPYGMQIKNGKTSTSNYYTLSFPCWKFSKKNGTADLRVKNNYIIWQRSYLYVDSFCIICKDPYKMVCFVRQLRQININIDRNKLENEKYKDVYYLKKLNSNSLSVDSIVNHFSSHPTDFEEYCANMFSKMGYSVTITPPVNDGGYDLFLEQSGKTTIVECKCYSSCNSIGRPAVQKLYGANSIAKANHLIFITTSQFSKSAIEYAQKVGIELIDGQRLLELLKHYKIINHNKISMDLSDWELNLSDLKPYIPLDIFQRYYS